MTETPEPGQSTGAERANRRRRLLPKILVAVAALLVVALGAVTLYAVTIERRITSNINRGVELPADTPSGSGSARPPARETGVLNYVLLGSDSRVDAAPGEGRSDSLLVVHLNAKRDKAYIISFPRDMYVSIPGHGKNKINAAFSLGGPALTLRTLEELTGTRMDHMVLVNFEGFIQLTEDLNGVTVTNQNAFSSHGYNYPKGRITIKGEEALWFVRERYALPRGDLDRAENQRNVIKAIVAKGLSADVISNPATFTSFVGNLAKHLTVDNGLTDAEIRSTALSLRLTGKDIQLLQAPIAGFATVGGQSIDVVDAAKMQELARALQDDDLAGYLKKYPQGE